MELQKEVRKVLKDLEKGQGSALYGALIMTRTTLIKSCHSLDQLVEAGGIPLLVRLLEQPSRHQGKSKILDIVMSILANICMEDNSIRDKVVSCDGIAVIARVTLSSEHTSIHNRGIRALANLAVDVTNCDQIHDLEVPAFVAKQLMAISADEEEECCSTYCRAIRLFGQTAKGVKQLVEETQAIQALASLIKSNSKKLVTKSLRTIVEFSNHRCCPAFAVQVLAANVLDKLVTLAETYSHENQDAQSLSISLILKLCDQSGARPALGSAGVISLLVKFVKGENKGRVNKISALNALCLFCKEAVNRKKIGDCGGLEVFLTSLKGDDTEDLSAGKFSVLHDRIISSLVNFLYHDECLSVLVDLGLVNLLLQHLRRCSPFSVSEVTLRSEINKLALTLMESMDDTSSQHFVLLSQSLEDNNNEMVDELTSPLLSQDHQTETQSAAMEASDAVVSSLEIEGNECQGLSERLDITTTVDCDTTERKTYNPCEKQKAHEEQTAHEERIKRNIRQATKCEDTFAETRESSSSNPALQTQTSVDGNPDRNNAVTFQEDIDDFERDSEMQADDGTQILTSVVDPLCIDKERIENELHSNTGRHNRNKEENSEHRKDGEQPSSTRRHIFSINSPTYQSQSESNWRAEDFIPGVTCKTSFEPSLLYHPSPTHNIETGGGCMSPYSPLSANVSYYSPAQSSPAHSQSLSPSQSPSNQSVGSAQIYSPNWSLPSPEPNATPTHSQSSESGGAYSPVHNSPDRTPGGPYSPLSNLYPGSPPLNFSESAIERALSPVFNSQLSLTSQSSGSEVLTFSTSPRTSEHIAQELRAVQAGQVQPLSFAIVPLSQDSQDHVINPVYSASEGEEEDETLTQMDCENKDEKVQNKNNAQSGEPTLNSVSGKQPDESLTSRNALSYPSTSKAVKELTFFTQQNDSIPRSPKRNVERETDFENRSKKAKLSFDSDGDTRLSAGSGDGRSRDTDIGHLVTGETHVSEDSSSQHSTSERANVDTDFCKSVRGKAKGKEIIKKRQVSFGFSPPSAEQSGDCSNLFIDKHEGLLQDGFNIDRDEPIIMRELTRSNSLEQKTELGSTTKVPSLVRMSSYPGKQKSAGGGLPFRLRQGPAGMPHGMSPLASASSSPYPNSSPFYSDSPYRSPFPESSQSPQPATRTVTMSEVSTDHQDAAHSASNSNTTASEETIARASRSAENQNQNSREAAASSSSDRPSSSGGDIQVSERVKKILQTTEANILILLSRLSAKTNPQTLIEIPVMNSLLSYLSLAANPLQRAARILNRIFENPLCFERLLLLQTPALIAQRLLLEADGLISAVMFEKEWKDRYGTLQRGKMCLRGLIGMQNSSDAGASQASDFGKKIDFEFGGDAYSKMMSPSSAGQMFRRHPSLSIDSQAARDSSGGRQDLHEGSRAESKVKLGLEMLTRLSITSMSAFGQGEIQHLLTRGSIQDQLACVVSMLYMPLGRDPFSRRQILSNFLLWDLAVPCLFQNVAPEARRAIVVALRFTLHLENPAKVLTGPIELPPCLDIDIDDPLPKSVMSDTAKSSISRHPTDVLRRLRQGNDKWTTLLGRVKTLQEMSKGHRTFQKHQSQDLYSDSAMTDNATSSCCYHQDSLDCDTCLIIQDDTEIRFQVNRDQLVKKSHVFAAMLSGTYAESRKSEITISDVNAVGFEFVLHYLHGCRSGCCVMNSILEVSSLKSNSGNEKHSAGTTGDICSNRTALADQGERPVSSLTPTSSSLQTDEASEPLCFSSVSTHALTSTVQSETKSVSVPLHKSSQCDTGILLSHSQDPISSSNLDSTSSNDSVYNLHSSQPLYYEVCDCEHPESSQKSLLHGLTQSENSATARSPGYDEKYHHSKQNSIKDSCSSCNTPQDQSPTTSQTTQPPTQEYSLEHETLTQESAVDQALGQLEEVVERCADIFAVADRFLLTNLISYVCCVLSSTWLHPHTCKAIFHLACFYKFDELAFDCAREAFLSTMFPSEVVSLFEELSDNGFRDPASKALAALLHSVLMVDK